MGAGTLWPRRNPQVNINLQIKTCNSLDLVNLSVYRPPSNCGSARYMARRNRILMGYLVVLGILSLK